MVSQKDQEIRDINIKDLVLWTENPRDAIDENATDQDIVDKAFEDNHYKWTLPKLAKEMGSRYDFSELPTVVYKGSKPIVYDGNRRIILGKIKLGLVKIKANHNIEIPEFPEEIPCNVCIESIAIENIYRKHSDTGSWQPLERDIFLHKFMRKPKSDFLLLDENTHFISTFNHLNQRFVKDEIFTKDNLHGLGFSFKKGKLESTHTKEEAQMILQDISEKVANKDITTRKSRGRIQEILTPISQRLISQNKNKQFRPIGIKFVGTASRKTPRLTKRTAKVEQQIFGGKLYLQIGTVSDLYRDIVDLYEYYCLNKSKLSESFPSLIRMALRLLCETAAQDNGQQIDKFLKQNFHVVKEGLSKDIKTMLANQNVTEKSVTQLIQSGAHNYKDSSNLQQTIALSIIIGGVLQNIFGITE